MLLYRKLTGRPTLGRLYGNCYSIAQGYYLDLGVNNRYYLLIIGGCSSLKKWVKTFLHLSITLENNLCAKVKLTKRKASNKIEQRRQLLENFYKRANSQPMNWLSPRETKSYFLFNSS